MTNKAKEAPEVVVVKMPPALVAVLDEIATREFRSRSDVLRQSLRHYALQSGGFCTIAA
jgi:metal-responsive CopG/Arc/MetJ family transcriptional regulator